MTPRQFAEDYIRRWEGGLSIDPNDHGNWLGGVCVGSKYGVTGATLAAYRGVVKVSAAQMAALDIGEAIDIALKLFYTQPGLDRLAWNRVTASVLDFGWGAGPVTSIKMLQGLLDMTQDGQPGPMTAQAYARLIGRGETFAAGAWWAMREQFYESLVARRPSDSIYLRGWDNRSSYFTPGHPERWWEKWNV